MATTIENEAPLETPDCEIVRDELGVIIDNLILRTNSTSKRLFGEASNYKKKIGLPKEAPGKKEYKNIAARLRKIKTEVDRGYKSVKPKEKKKQSSNSTKTGFKRLVLLSEKLSQVMRLGDWGLASGADPTRCICTHSRVTRYLSNYLELNDLYTKIDKKSVWVADETLLNLFADEWETTGVDPEAAKYTDLQKLLVKHMKGVDEENSFEDRNEEDYRIKLNDESEFARATGDVMRLRNELKDLTKAIGAKNRNVTYCRRNRKDQGLGAIFEEELKGLVDEFNAKTAELQKICKENEFSRSDSYPKVPKTVLSQ